VFEDIVKEIGFTWFGICWAIFGFVIGLIVGKILTYYFPEER